MEGDDAPACTKSCHGVFGTAKKEAQYFFLMLLHLNGKQLVGCITRTCKDTACLHNLNLSAHPYEKLTE